jgi:hypothetical protein
MVWLQVDVFPHASVALHVLVCNVGHEPLTWSVPTCAIVGVPIQSVAVGVPNTGVAPHSATKLEGHTVNTGATLSVVTVNVALQVLGASQELVTVNVTVLLPPHLLGADPPLLVTVPRPHPPDACAVASHAVYAAATCSCVLQDGMVVLLAHVSVTAGAAVTVNVALQVLTASQELVTLNVTVLLPPHAAGADPPLLVTVPSPHPPDACAVNNHAP